jgi:hypothetical protein
MPGCITCTSSSVCTTCDTIKSYTRNGSTCDTCSSLLTRCLTCSSNTTCTTCDTANHYVLIGSVCVTCRWKSRISMAACIFPKVTYQLIDTLPYKRSTLFANCSLIHSHFQSSDNMTTLQCIILRSCLTSIEFDRNISLLVNVTLPSNDFG